MVCQNFAQAQGETAVHETPWYSNTTYHLFFSTGYSYNVNQPSSGKNQFRLFDVNDQTVRLDVAELLVEKKPQHPGDAGFRIDFTAGSSIPKAVRSAGLNTGDFDVHQLYFSYIIPFEKGLRFDAGKFLTYHGYEGIEGYDCLNDNATRSFLAAYATPTTHTGIRITYPVLNNLSLLLVYVNGWDNSIDSNKAKTVGGQVSYAPWDGWSFLINLCSGPERAGDNSHTRNLYEFVGIVMPVHSVTAGINVIYGTEQRWPGTGGDVEWSGGAVYFKYFLKENFSLCLRAEQFFDRQGTRSGIPQHLKELTFTPEWRVNPHIIVRSDMRYDVSDQSVFEKGMSMVKTQPTIGLNVLCLF